MLFKKFIKGSYLWLLDVNITKLQTNPSEGSTNMHCDIIKEIMEEVMSQLVVAHNLNASKLETIDLMGGLACPSLAIINNEQPYSDFGDVTLLMGADKISPNIEPIFHSDIYSPRTPIPKYNVDRLGLVSITDEIRKTMEELGLSELSLPGDLSGSESLLRGIPYTVSGLVENEVMLAAYAHSKGVKFDIPYEKESSVVPFLNVQDPAFDAIAKLNEEDLVPGASGFNFLNEVANRLVDDYAEKSPGNTKNAKIRMLNMWFEKVGENYVINDILAYIMVEKSKETSSKPTIDTYALKDNLVSMFDAKDVYKWIEERLTGVVGSPYFSTYNDQGEETLVPYTLDNLTEYLKGDIRGQENFFYGAGSIRSLISEQFDSWDSIVLEKSRLMRKEDFEPLADAFNAELSKFSSFMKDYMPSGSDHALSDTAVYNHIATYAKSGDKSEIQPYVKVDDMPNEYFVKLDKFLVELKNSPTAYFEVKMQRQVSLSEFDYAVIPDSAPDKVKELLSKAGICISEYKAGDEMSRKEALQSQPVMSVEKVVNKPVLDVKKKNDEQGRSISLGFR